MHYKITAIRERKEMDDKGVVREYVHIRFSIDRKFRGSVTLPKKGFTTDKAKKKIEEYVLELKPLLEAEKEA